MKRHVLLAVALLGAAGYSTVQAIPHVDITVEQDNRGVHVRFEPVDLEPTVYVTQLFIDNMIWAVKNAPNLGPYDVYGYVDELGFQFAPGIHTVFMDRGLAGGIAGRITDLSFTVAPFDPSLPSSIPGLPSVPDTGNTLSFCSLGFIGLAAARKAVKG